MAKIKKISSYEKQGAAKELIPAQMETVEENLQTHSVRVPEKWVAVMGELASSLSVLRGKRIRVSDIMREAIFQYCIKKALNDERETILRSSKEFEGQAAND